jgi:hypothetical protein
MIKSQLDEPFAGNGAEARDLVADNFNKFRVLSHAIL